MVPFVLLLSLLIISPIFLKKIIYEFHHQILSPSSAGDHVVRRPLPRFNTVLPDQRGNTTPTKNRNKSFSQPHRAWTFRLNINAHIHPVFPVAFSGFGPDHLAAKHASP
jgi:hypothetical protein